MAQPKQVKLSDYYVKKNNNTITENNNTVTASNKNIVTDANGNVIFEEKNNHSHTKSQITDFPTLSTVATSGSYNDLSGLPTIPSASITTPSADTTNGSVGSSSNYAKADHQHPLSGAYATSGHSHTGMLTSSDVGTSSDTSSSKIVACNDTRLSDARTPTSHIHTYGNITGVSTVQVLVTYTDNSTETLNLLKYTLS